MDASYDTRDDCEQPQAQDASAASEPKTKKKRSRGRRRKAKGRNNVEPTHKKQPASKKHHDAPMKKRDLYFSMTCAMVSIKGGASVVARVAIVNWDMETVLDTFVHVPVPVVDFKNSGISPGDIQKSRSNTKARCFSEVRQMVEQILRGKILIGHQLAEKLTALGLTHPSTDVRDTSVFFKDADLRLLCQKLLKRDLVDQDSSDVSFESCSTCLDLYKTYRKEWEEDLIKRAQQSQQQSFVQMKTAARPASPQYNVYHLQDPQRPRFPNYENPQVMTRAYAHSPQAAQGTQPQHYQENSSWYVRGNPNMAAPAQPASTPVLSSRAMQALSSYSHPSSPSDEVYDHGSSMSYDGSTLYESSTDYNGSVFDTSSVASGSMATASVASWQEEDAPSESSTSSSWFRFGSRKSSSVLPDEMCLQTAHRRMSAVCEEKEDEIAAAASEEMVSNGSKYEPPRDGNDAKQSSSSWFAFRRSKSPGAGKREKGEVDELNNSRSHASRDLKLLLKQSPSEESATPSDDTTQPPSEEGSRDMAEQKDELSEMGPSGEKSSSWFSFRRSKSPTVGTSKQQAAPTSNNNEKELAEPSESTYTDDEDWLQEVMEKPSDKMVTFSKEDGLEESASSGSSSKLFRFLRPSPNTMRSRLPSLDDEEIEPQATASFDEDTDVWLDQSMNNNAALSDGWNGSSQVATTGGLFYSPARPRFPTESTIQSVASEENEEDEASYSQDLLIGMEQNLAFLNI